MGSKGLAARCDQRSDLERIRLVEAARHLVQLADRIGDADHKDRWSAVLAVEKASLNQRP